MSLAGARVLVTGAGGFIGRHVDARLRAAGAEVFSSLGEPAHRAEFTNAQAAATLVRELGPDVVVNAAAMARAADCEIDPARAMRINRDAAVELADAAREIGARLVHFSTDQVFDGASGPYVDTAPPSPIHAYGRTKAAADAALLASPEGRCILRPTLVYGRSADGRTGASDAILAAAAAGRTLDLFIDEWRRPVPASFVAEVVAAAADSQVVGPINVAGAERVSRHAFGLAVCDAAHVDPAFLREASLAAWTGTPRPADLDVVCLRLRDELGLEAPGLEESLAASV